MRNKMVQSDNFSQHSKIADESDVRQQSKWCVSGRVSIVNGDRNTYPNPMKYVNNLSST